MSERYSEKKEQNRTVELSEMGKTIQLAETVSDCIERIDCRLAQELQELWDEAYVEGAESREVEVAGLLKELSELKLKINAILNALA